MNRRIKCFATSAIHRMAMAASRAVALALMLSAFYPLSAGAEAIRVAVDEAALQRLGAPAATIIVGNPYIADVTIQGSDLLIVTGKTFGTTNLIVLDDAGEKIAYYNVVVHKAGAGNVTLYRGTGRVSYNCAPRCERTLEVGDDAKEFDTTKTEISDKAGLSRGGSGAGGVPQ